MRPDIERRIRIRTRRRFVFSGLVMVLYFSFVINWTSAGASLRETMAGSSITGSLLMFSALVLTFVLLEAVFLWRASKEPTGDE